MSQVSSYKVWIPRILSIVFILFLIMFSLDVFAPGLSAQEIAIGLFMHNIPAMLLAIVVAISWKYELVGGIVFILAGILYVVLLLMNPQLQWYMLSWSLIIAGPAFLVGTLFLMNWRQKKKL